MIKLLLTDLDGTLIDGSGVLQFASYLIEIGVIEDNLVRLQWEEDKKNETKICNYGDYFKKSLKGLDYNYIENLAEDFVNSDILQYYPQAINILKQKKEDNYMCIIISGSCDFLVEKIAKRFGIFGYGAYYELKNEKFTGEVAIPTYSYNVKKDIIENLIRPEYISDVVGLGDTVSDIAIAEYSDEFYLVQPNEYTRWQYLKLNVDFTEI